MALRHVFTTVNFKTPFEAADRVRQAFAQITRELPASPIYVSFEQKGSALQTMGARPHIHIVGLDVSGADFVKYKAIIARYFARDDELTERISGWRANHLVNTFLARQEKVGRSAEEKYFTRMWRTQLGLPTSMRHRDVVARSKELK